MAETHPNAFRVEASAKRTQANQLSNEADALDARADELEKELNLPLTTPSTPEDQFPVKGQTVDPKTDIETEKKSKVPFKK